MMVKLKLNYNGKEINLEADFKIAKGIYAASESKIAKNNAEKLEINFDYSLPDNMLQNRQTKIGKWSFLTQYGAGIYVQYIFMPSAEQSAFDTFLKEFENDKQMQQQLINTYNMAKLDMNNIEILDNLNDSSN